MDRLEIAYINIVEMPAGHLVRVEWADDDLKADKFYFDTIDEVLAFLETNLD